MRHRLISLIGILVLLATRASVYASDLPSGGTVHVVQAGQTLFSIARWYGVDLWAVARANHIVNPNHIYVGQRLTIPTHTAPPASSGVYVVKPGDTLYGIARIYGVDAWAIARANGLYNVHHIYVGQRLLIPGVSPPPAPSPAPTAAPSAPSVPTTGGWRGEYYAGTTPHGGPLFIRYDRAVNFHWGLTSPDTRLNTDEFSVHWTREINFRGGLYRFRVTVDDGARLWVDGNLVMDQWRVQPETSYDVDVVLTPGKHPVAIDYFDNTGNATIQFTFKRLGDAPVDVTPTPPATLAPTVTPTTTVTPPDEAPASAWLGQYFGNISLSGAPVVTRTDPGIHFEWGGDAPMSGIPDNFFSARWTRQVFFYEDNYVFCARADDGVRLYVDDVLVIDEWHGSPGYENYCAEVEFIKGTHRLMVEYYEEGRDALIHVWWERR